MVLLLATTNKGKVTKVAVKECNTYLKQIVILNIVKKAVDKVVS